MEMVTARHAGVAFSEPGTYDDLVNVASGLADGLVSGDVAGERLEIPRLERAERGWPTRLRALLADVRRVFGDEPWDIEWADDGDVCWLVQIRPITAPTIRNETLTAANHAEILPRLPSQLMTQRDRRGRPRSLRLVPRTGTGPAGGPRLPARRRRTADDQPLAARGHDAPPRASDDARRRLDRWRKRERTRGVAIPDHPQIARPSLVSASPRSRPLRRRDLTVGGSQPSDAAPPARSARPWTTCTGPTSRW